MRPPSPAGLAALSVLAKLGDTFAASVASTWVERDEMGALVPLGLLAPEGAVELLTRVIAVDREINEGWFKRLSAHALGSIGNDAALDVLERLLADRNWFARLGAAEALAKLNTGRATQLLMRARDDIDARVAAVARRQG